MRRRVIVSLLALSFIATISVCTPIQAETTPITNVIVIWKENRTFDHYFGKLQSDRFYACGRQDKSDCVDGLSGSETNPVSFQSRDPHTCILSGPSGTRKVAQETKYCAGGGGTTLNSWDAMHSQYNAGANNGFAYMGGCTTDPTESCPAMNYFTDAVLNYYYDLASGFAIGDRYFSSVLTQSWPNMAYFNTATSCTFVVNGVNCPSNAPFLTSVLRQNPPTTYKYYCTNSDGTLCRQTTDSFFTDVQNQNLPNISFIECGDCDEHPGGNVTVGQYATYQIISAVFKSTYYWGSTQNPNQPGRAAIFLVYDEGGGYYDHVAPLNACPPCWANNVCPAGCATCHTCPSYDGPPYIPGTIGASCDQTKDLFTLYGFRVPFVVVSPYAKRHYVSHNTYDHTSLLKFFEYNWPYGPGGATRSLTDRDGNANNLLELFDFSTSVSTLPSLRTPVPSQCN